MVQASVIRLGRRPRRWRWVAAGVGLLAAASGAHVVAEELRSSRWQSRRLAERAQQLRFETRPGANPALHVPAHGLSTSGWATRASRCMCSA